jgi:hypothetical protein
MMKTQKVSFHCGQILSHFKSWGLCICKVVDDLSFKKLEIKDQKPDQWKKFFTHFSLRQSPNFMMKVNIKIIN